MRTRCSWLLIAARNETPAIFPTERSATCRTQIAANSPYCCSVREDVSSIETFSQNYSRWTIGACAGTFSIIQEASQYPRAAWVLQLSQRLGFDLPDSLARHRELLADLLQRVVLVHADAESHAKNALLARRQGRQHAGRGFAQVRLDGSVDRQDRVLVLDEIAEVGIRSSPTGVSSDNGSLAILSTLRTFSSGMRSFSANSSGMARGRSR